MTDHDLLFHHTSCGYFDLETIEVVLEAPACGRGDSLAAVLSLDTDMVRGLRPPVCSRSQYISRVCAQRSLLIPQYLQVGVDALGVLFVRLFSCPCLFVSSCLLPDPDHRSMAVAMSFSSFDSLVLAILPSVL